MAKRRKSRMSGERMALLKDLYEEMLTTQFISERRKEIRHIKGRGHVFTFVNLTGQTVTEAEVDKVTNYKFLLDYLATFTGNLPTQAEVEEVLAKISSEKVLNNFDSFGKHQAWSIIEGGQHRSLASYVCNRAIRTKSARQGHSNMAGLKQLVLMKLKEKGLLDDSGKKIPTYGRSRERLDSAEKENGEKQPAEVPPSQPRELLEGEPPKKKKRTKESFPPPDRLPSSEYYSESEDSDDEGGDGNEMGKPVTLHEELHEELYGSTPKKSVDRAGSGDVALTEVENTPGGQTIDDSDDDDVVEKSTAEPSQNTTGAHKDTRPLTTEIAQRVMKRAAKAKGDPQDEQDEDSDAKYKAEAYDDGMPKGNRKGRGRGRGKSKGKGKSRGKGMGKPTETTEAPNETKAEEKQDQLSGVSPECSKESNNEKSDSDQEGKKPVRASASQEAVRGTPEKKKQKQRDKEPKTRKNTPLKGRSPKQIKKAVAATKKSTPQDLLAAARPSLRHFDPPEDWASKKSFTLRHPHGELKQAGDGLNVCSIGVMMDRGATFYVYKVPASRVTALNERSLAPLPVSVNKLEGVSLGWAKFGGVGEAWRIAMMVAGWEALAPTMETETD
eukprot:s332_g7.t1